MKLNGLKINFLGDSITFGVGAHFTAAFSTSKKGKCGKKVNTPELNTVLKDYEEGKNSKR